MRAAGFSLVETLIYLALFCMIGLVAARFLGDYHLAVVASQRKSLACIAVHTAAARLRQDIQMADPSALSWQQNGSADLSFIDCSGKQIRWSLQRGNLYRIQEHTKALIAQGIDRVSFKLTAGEEQIEQLACIICSEGHDYIQTLRPCNGAL